MNLALNTLLSRAVVWRRGSLRLLTSLEQRTFEPVSPAKLFPRVGRVRIGNALSVQHTQRTCGTAVLGLVNALFAPEQLQHLRARGTGLGPKERGEVAAHRFSQLQRRLLQDVTSGNWPPSLGTPPWGLARELRVPGVRYQHLPVDDRNAPLTEVLTGVLQRALEAGIPIPLYVGGSVSTGASAAVPRHVVLAVPPAAMTSAPSNDYVRIYDPASGRVYRREWSTLWARSKPDRAFGGWTHVAWVVLPQGSEPTGGG